MLVLLEVSERYLHTPSIDNFDSIPMGRQNKGEWGPVENTQRCPQSSPPCWALHEPGGSLWWWLSVGSWSSTTTRQSCCGVSLLLLPSDSYYRLLWSQVTCRVLSKQMEKIWPLRARIPRSQL